jgi:CheY-like chemotaxis protein
MPEMDGYAFVMEVRRIEKASGNTTPIFAITASDYDLTAEKAQSFGFDGYKLKPLDLEVFKKKLTGLKKKHPDISGAAPP